MTLTGLWRVGCWSHFGGRIFSEFPASTASDHYVNKTVAWPNWSGKIGKKIWGGMGTRFGNDEVWKKEEEDCRTARKGGEGAWCRGGGTVRGAGWVTLTRGGGGVGKLKAQGGRRRRGTWLRKDRSWKKGMKWRFREEIRWEMHREMEWEGPGRGCRSSSIYLLGLVFPSSCAAPPPPCSSHTLSLISLRGKNSCAAAAAILNYIGQWEAVNMLLLSDGFTVWAPFLSSKRGEGDVGDRADDVVLESTHKPGPECLRYRRTTRGAVNRSWCKQADACMPRNRGQINHKWQTQNLMQG